MSSLRQLTQAAWFPYVAPFTLFMVLTYAGASLPGSPALWYALKTLLVGTLLLAFRGRFPELRVRFDPVNWLLGVVAGLVVLVIWVAPEKLLEPLLFTTPKGFHPYLYAEAGVPVAMVIGVRILGASVVVPIMEELFWRSFLMRYLVHSNFREVAMGTFRLVPFLIVAVAFGFEHHRWLVGILAGLVYGGLLVWRRDLFTIVLAHAVTNLGLGIYVVVTERWSFW